MNPSYRKYIQNPNKTPLRLFQNQCLPANAMKSYWWVSLLLLLLTVVISWFTVVFAENQVYQVGGSHHDDHLNDETDDIPNDYTPFIIPIDSGKRIIIAPIITCTIWENDTWNPFFHPCKMAQTFLVDTDWNDGNANYTYIFEDWIDFDWNDIVVNFYASMSYGVFSDLFLAFREAGWKNPFSLEITTEDTWIKIEWNSTDYPETNSLMVSDGETVEVNLFTESNPGDQAFLRFLVPPVAGFSWNPQFPLVGETVVFNASESYDLDKEIETYSWVFGDGASVDTDNSMIPHSFTSSGTYGVTLTVTDSDGLTNIVSKPIKVLAIIGGETTSVDNILVTIWKSINLLLVVMLAVTASLIRKRKNSAANFA